MLKRYQIMLTKWLMEYVQFVSEKYDLSIPEIIRIILCMEIGYWASTVYPKYKFGVTNAEIHKKLTKPMKNKTLEELHHALISKVYFEARKAIEFFLAQEKKSRK